VFVKVKEIVLVIIAYVFITEPKLRRGDFNEVIFTVIVDLRDCNSDWKIPGEYLKRSILQETWPTITQGAHE
jgi:hypothetical protein